MTASVVYVGMDVHKESIVIAVAREGREPAETWKTIPHDAVQLRKALKSLTQKGEVLRICYEAGPTGFGLCRSLRKAGREHGSGNSWYGLGQSLSSLSSMPARRQRQPRDESGHVGNQSTGRPAKPGKLCQPGSL